MPATLTRIWQVLPERADLQRKAHTLVHSAVRKGYLVNLALTRIPCVDCGERAYVWDHRDYREPLVVSPVCKRCNIRRPLAAPVPEGFRARNEEAVRQTEIQTCDHCGSVRWIRDKEKRS